MRQGSPFGQPSWMLSRGLVCLGRPRTSALPAGVGRQRGQFLGQLGEAGIAQSQSCATQGAECWSAGFFLRFPSLLSHLTYFLLVPWTVHGRGREATEPDGKGITTSESRGGGLATGIIFKRMSLFVILIRDVIDYG